MLSAAEAGLLGHSDEQHLEKARALNRVILSRDQDFLFLAHRCAVEAFLFPGLIFIHPKGSVGEVIRSVTLLAELLSPEDIAGWIEWVP